MAKVDLITISGLTASDGSFIASGATLKFDSNFFAASTHIKISPKLYRSRELFENGYNYLQKKIMLKTIENVVNFDINLLKQKNILQIISLEEYTENFIEIEGMKPIKILGYIDRIDKLNDTIRVIDYKSAKSNNLSINDKNFDENFAGNSEYNQSLQLTLYAYMLLNNGKYNEVECGIWSLKYASQGVKSLNFNKKQNLDLVSISEPMEKIKNLILEILNSEIPFIEREKEEFSY